MITEILKLFGLTEMARKWEELNFFVKGGMIMLLVLFFGGILLAVLFLTGLLNFDPSWNTGEGGLFILSCYLGACLLFLGVCFFKRTILPGLDKFAQMLDLLFLGDITSEDLEEMDPEERGHLCRSMSDTPAPGDYLI